jgi:hypothetical protein
VNGLARAVRQAPRALIFGVAIAAVMAGAFVPLVFALHGSRDSWSVASDPLSLVALVANALVVALFVAARRGRRVEDE